MENEENFTVSVIIPMYNTEKYIGECLQSLLKQTLKNFEVIVVDDCSTDKSLKVAEKMFPAFKSKNLKLSTVAINKNTGCPGIPRNIALNIAEGKYIYFLDSDDFLDETVLEDFYKAAEEFDADIVHAQKSFGHIETDGNFKTTLINLEKVDHVEKPTLDTSDISQRVVDFIGKKYTSWVWNKFFRREFLIENGIKFPATLVAEDFVFLLVCFSLAKNYVNIPFVGHHYRKREGSVTKSAATAAVASLNLIEGVHALDSFMQQHEIFVKNPDYQYLTMDVFDQKFSDLLSKHLFFNMDLEPGEVYDFYRKEIFTVNPQKNIPLTAYLFISKNIYKMLVNQQAAEIAQLKQIIKELK